MRTRTTSFIPGIPMLTVMVMPISRPLRPYAEREGAYPHGGLLGVKQLTSHDRLQQSEVRR